TEIETKGISIGQSVVDEMNFWHKPVNSHILTEVDNLRFMQSFLQRTCSIDSELLEKILPQLISEESFMKKLSTKIITILALFIALNIVRINISLLIKLHIYLYT